MDAALVSRARADEDHAPSRTVLPAWDKRPLIISGPCSAETEEQLLATARRLAATGMVDMLRAGVWKPRTRPNTFEGVGAKALPWLRRAREETGLPTAVEVATGKQVQDALTFGVDVLWIGARTTGNPFSVQDVADALKGVDVPVLVKNPMSPDLELWIGALERLARAGVTRTGLIHRGFHTYGNTEYRNAPMWHLAIEMKRRNPGTLIINDPSHICGRRETLQPVIQKAIDLGFDGLMIESHVDPPKAWSDTSQQVTPERLEGMLEAVTWRKERVCSEELNAALERLRQEIDNIDDEMMQLLSRRMKLAEQIGRHKKDNNVTILQAARWNQILERALRKSEEAGLSKEFVTRFFEAVHEESIHHQEMVPDGAP